MLLLSMIACVRGDADLVDATGCDPSTDFVDPGFDWLYQAPADGVPALGLVLPDASMATLATYDDDLWAWYLDQANVVKPKAPVVCGALDTPYGLLGNVLVKPKGKLFSSYQPIDGKPNLEVYFHDNEGLVGGQNSVKLYNQWEDLSQVARYLGNEIFREAGYPAARAGFATLSLNGRDIGLYGTTEATASDAFFAARASAGAHLEDPDRPFADIESIYEGDYGADFLPEKVEKLIEGADRHTDADDDLLRAFAGRVSKVPVCDLDDRLDVVSFLDFWALETLIGAPEGYTYLSNNFNVADDQERGYILTPTGFDQVLVVPQPVCAPRGALAVAALKDRACARRGADALAALSARIRWADHEAELDGLIVALQPHTDADTLLPHPGDEIVRAQDQVRAFLHGAPARTTAMLAEGCLQ